MWVLTSSHPQPTVMSRRYMSQGQRSRPACRDPSFTHVREVALHPPDDQASCTAGSMTHIWMLTAMSGSPRKSSSRNILMWWHPHRCLPPAESERQVGRAQGAADGLLAITRSSAAVVATRVLCTNQKSRPGAYALPCRACPGKPPSPRAVHIPR